MRGQTGRGARNEAGSEGRRSRNARPSRRRRGARKQLNRRQSSHAIATPPRAISSGLRPPLARTRRTNTMNSLRSIKEREARTRDSPGKLRRRKGEGREGKAGGEEESCGESRRPSRKFNFLLSAVEASFSNTRCSLLFSLLLLSLCLSPVSLFCLENFSTEKP